VVDRLPRERGIDACAILRPSRCERESASGKGLRHYFCRTCGTFTHIADGESAKDSYHVSLGCVEGLNPLALAIKIIDGMSVPLVEEWR
jgi:hypothetical protein